MRSRLVPLFLSLILTLFIYPSAFLYPFDTLPDRNDTRLIAYIIGQVQENLVTSKNLHYGTFFAPEPNTLTYSDLFLTSSFIGLPIRLFTDHPIFIFNFIFILNTTLTIFCSFHFFRMIFNSQVAGLLATLIFNLSGFHLHYYPHLQIFSLWIFFSALTSLQRFIKNQKIIHLTSFFIFTTLQLAESIFTTYLLFFTAFFMIIPHLKKLSPHLLKLRFLVFPVIWTYLLLPYYQTHNLYEEASRPIRDAAHFSLGIDQIFTFYHSWVVIALLVFAVIASKKYLKTWTPLLIFSLIMSLGPVLKILGQTVKIGQLFIPLPYTLFYYLFPGFTGFRTPSRFIILALLASVIIICTYLNPIFAKLKTRTQIIFLLLIFSVLALEAKLPLSSYAVNINMHPVYEQVKTLPPDSVILELPIKLWNDPDHQIESIRSLYSLYHHHRRLGGYSGFATLKWINLIHQIQSEGLSASVVDKLRSFGVTHIIQNNSLFLLPIGLAM